jgi:hypothetical protein
MMSMHSQLAPLRFPMPIEVGLAGLKAIRLDRRVSTAMIVRCC